MVADLKKRKLQIINTMTGKEVQAFVQSIADLPQSVKDRYRRLVTGK